MEDEKCLICSQIQTTKEDYKILVKKGGENCKLLIVKKLIFPKEMIITTAQMCMKELRIFSFGNAFGLAHKACKKIFDLWYTEIKDKYGEK